MRAGAATGHIRKVERALDVARLDARSTPGSMCRLSDPLARAELLLELDRSRSDMLFGRNSESGSSPATARGADDDSTPGSAVGKSGEIASITIQPTSRPSDDRQRVDDDRDRIEGALGLPSVSPRARSCS